MTDNPALRETTTEEMRLACAKTVCWCCLDEGQPIARTQDTWYHGVRNGSNVRCKASAIWDIGRKS